MDHFFKAKEEYELVSSQESDELRSILVDHSPLNLKRGVTIPLSKVPWIFAGTLAAMALFDLPFIVNCTILMAEIIFLFLVRPGSLVLSNRRDAGSLFYGRRRRMIGTFLAILNVSLCYFLQEFEISGDRGYEYAIEDNYDTNSPFYRINDDKVSYNEAVLALNSAMNRRNVAKEVTFVNATRVDLWSSDTLRYDFMLRYWSNKTMNTPFACILESDMVVDLDFFSQEIPKRIGQGYQVFHVQHMWGHSSFEPYNIGIFCTVKQPSLYVRLWMRALRFLHSTRYRRMILLGFFWEVLGNKRFVFEWDLFGCSKYKENCKYVHFTRPKMKGIAEALRYIQSSDGGDETSD